MAALPPNPNPTFVSDLPGAIVYPAHPSNYYRPNEGPVFHPPAEPRGIVLHTPEEAWDDYESTPIYFAGANRRASTTFYADSDGDKFHIVPPGCMPFANGVVGKPYPAWADPNHNLNWQTESIEIEGRAASIQDTFKRGSPQWFGVIDIIRQRSKLHGWPIDRSRVIGHYEVSIERTDPGPLFPWDDLMTDLLIAEVDFGMLPLLIENPAPEFETFIWTGSRLLKIPTRQVREQLAAFYRETLNHDIGLGPKGEDPRPVPPELFGWMNDVSIPKP